MLIALIVSVILNLILFSRLAYLFFSFNRVKLPVKILNLEYTLLKVVDGNDKVILTKQFTYSTDHLNEKYKLAKKLSKKYNVIYIEENKYNCWDSKQC